jgi:ribosomal protein S18 acetylase RimI-like enzyme
MYEVDPNTQDVKADVGLTFLEFEQRPEKGRLIVFDDDGNVVGYCIIIFFWSNEYGGNIIDIDEICVARERRRSSLATDLIVWLEKTFSTEAVGFTLEIAHHNKAAESLVKKMGFAPVRNQHMIKVSGR